MVGVEGGLIDFVPLRSILSFPALLAVSFASNPRRLGVARLLKSTEKPTA